MLPLLPIAALAFVIGACLLQRQDTLPNVWLAVWLLLPACYLLLMTILNKLTRIKINNNIGKWSCMVAVLLLFLGAGFFNAAWRAESRMANRLPSQLHWKDITVEGIVRGFADTNERRTRFVLDIHRIVQPNMELTLRAQMAIYHHDTPPPNVIKDGANIRARVRIRPPRENVNPTGFDYAGYLFARNILAAGYVRGDLTLLSSGGGVRENLRAKMYALPQQGESLAALIIGDRTHISEAQWQIMRRTGTAHLLSISGTHITLAGGFAALLCGWFWRRRQRLTQILPAQQAALLAAVVAASLYAWLAGFGVPVVRSVLMFMAIAAAFVCGGMMSALQAIAIAALLVVFVDPWAVVSAGFWLSFILAAAVVYAAAHQGLNMQKPPAFPNRKVYNSSDEDSPTQNKQSPTQSKHTWAVLYATYQTNLVFRLFYLQLLMSLSAVPLTLWFFGEASLVSPLANLFAVPFIGIFVLPLALLDVLIPGDFLWQLCGVLLNWFWQVLAYLSDIPYASLRASAPWWLFAAAGVGAVWLLSPRGMPLRWCGALPIAAMLLWSPPSLPTGALRLTALDIGQGTAVLMQTRNHVVLYDTGAPYSFSVINSMLHTLGSNRHLDMLIISHDDIDHSGAATKIISAHSPKKLLASLPSSHALITLAGEAYMPCRAGAKWIWDDVEFTVLHPPKNVTITPSTDNESSCVVRVVSPYGEVLLSGDIPIRAEEELIGSGVDLSAAVLLAPHHGSRYSSSSLFLQAVSPQYTIFSAGANNRYGHPHSDTLQRTRLVDSLIYRTDKDGAIVIDMNAEGISVQRWRDINKRYWRVSD